MNAEYVLDGVSARVLKDIGIIEARAEQVGGEDPLGSAILAHRLHRDELFHKDPVTGIITPTTPLEREPDEAGPDLPVGKAGILR